MGVLNFFKNLFTRPLATLGNIAKPILRGLGAGLSWISNNPIASNLFNAASTAIGSAYGVTVPPGVASATAGLIGSGLSAIGGIIPHTNLAK